MHAATPSIEDSYGASAVSDRLIDGWNGTPFNTVSRCEGPMDPLPIFGLGAVSSMLVTCVLEGPCRGSTLAFAGTCILGSLCGLLQDAWPIGAIEGVGALVALGSLRKRG